MRHKDLRLLSVSCRCVKYPYSTTVINHVYFYQEGFSSRHLNLLLYHDSKAVRRNRAVDVYVYSSLFVPVQAFVSIPRSENTSHHIPLHLIPSHPIPSHHNTLHLITSHYIPSHDITSHLITTYPVPSHPIPSQHITSHPISSQHIPSHPIPSHPIPLHHMT